MKKASILLVTGALMLSSCAKNGEVKELKTEIDSVSYAIGLDLRKQIPPALDNLNSDAFLDGCESLSKEGALIDENKLGDVMNSFQQVMQKRQFAEREAEMAAGAIGEEYVPEPKEQGTFKSGEKVLENQIDSLSYAYGMITYNQIKNVIPELSFDPFKTGFKQGLNDADGLLIEMDQANPIIQAYINGAREREGLKFKEEGLAFLAENAKRDGVVVTESGLQYEIVQKGNDTYPTAESNVTVHYTGETPEGVVFDSSRTKDAPASFGLNQVIKGWTEGVQLMGEGAIYKFYIPQELAYGSNPRPNSPIKPYMPLVFEVELISVNN
jgi:FKBP-type peptidyl-prolyl cis-trans isomerase